MANRRGSQTIFDHLDDATMLRVLPDSLTQTYKHGIDSGEITVYESSKKIELSDAGVDYIAHLVPSLADKPPAGETLPDLGSKPEKDPFQPPFVPEELVGDLEHYYILLNKYCFVPEQFVVVTKRWAVQADPLEEMDLGIAWEILQSFETAGKPLFAFYNCGNRSGGSQPHRHIQFSNVQEDEDGDEETVPPVEKLALSLNLKYEPDQKPHTLPTPYLHLVSPLPSHSPSSPLTPSLLHSLYTSHLRLHPSAASRHGSHNVLLTQHHLHTIPRSERDVTLFPDVEGKEVRMGPNGLMLSGYWFLEKEEEIEALREWGVAKGVTEVGYKREGGGETDKDADPLVEGGAEEDE